MQKTTSKKSNSKAKTASKAASKTKKASTPTTDVSNDLASKEISTSVKPKTKTESKKSVSSKTKPAAKKKASSTLKKQEPVKEPNEKLAEIPVKEPIKNQNIDKDINVTFIVNNTSTSIGENIFISGNSDTLGNWNIDKAVKLNTDESIYPTWRTDIDLPLNTEIEFKFLCVKDCGDHKDICWENSENRILIVNENAKVYECSWK